MIEGQNRNIFIETGEKKQLRTEYVPTGILRDDNSIFYLIGDYSSFFIFAKRDLLLLNQKNQSQHLFRMIELPTTKGFLLPIKVAYDVALKVVINNPLLLS